jgi:hypothetical protein
MGNDRASTWGMASKAGIDAGYRPYSPLAPLVVRLQWLVSNIGGVWVWYGLRRRYERVESMQSKVSHSWLTALPNACAMTLVSCALVSCGGGGGGSSSTSTPTPTPTPTPTSTIVTGVAAVGAPLVDAQIRVLDGSGTAVALQDGNGNTIPYASSNVADGSYKFVIPSGTPKMPLFIEARAIDANGTPVVLHSLVQSESSSGSMVANITPLTDAVVAEILGANPMTVFQKASASATSIANLGNATQVTAASTQIKTIIAKNLTDAKAASSTSLDLFQDSTFVTNKTGVDAALEALRIQIIPGGSGDDLLQISNKFVALATPEVTIDLATAKKQLAAGSSGTLSSAITSTLKTTTSSTTSVANFGSLDNLTIAVNDLIAQRAPNTSFAALLSATPTAPTPVLPAGKTAAYAFNGRQAADLENLLALYASDNYQLSSVQVLGCIDDPIPSKGCTNFAIAAVVTDVSGNVVDVFRDGVAYNKSTTPNWMFSGNGRYANMKIYPVTYATFGFDGSLSATSGLSANQSSAGTAATNNPGLGLQVAITDLDSSGNQLVGNSAVQLPTDQSVPFAFCGTSLLCIWPQPAVLPTATGELSDTLLQQPALGWIGSADAVLGAKFVFTYASWITVTNQTANVYLQAGLPANLGSSLYPMADGISASNPVTGANIVAGYNLSWVNWADANPNMAVFSVRTIVNSTGSSPLITDDPVTFGATSASLAPTSLPSGFTPTSYEIWLGAVDNLGHRYYTQLLGTN